jgi:hypothetical protein
MKDKYLPHASTSHSAQQARCFVQGEKGQGVRVTFHPAAQEVPKTPLFNVELFRFDLHSPHGLQEANSLVVERGALLLFLSDCASGGICSLMSAGKGDSMILKGARTRGNNQLLLALCAGETRQVSVRLPFDKFYYEVFRLNHLFNQGEAWKNW